MRGRPWWALPRPVQLALTAVLAVVALTTAAFALLRGPGTDATAATPTAVPTVTSSSPTATPTASPGATAAPGSSAATSTGSPTSTAASSPAPTVRVVYLGDAVSGVDTVAGRSDWAALSAAGLQRGGTPVERVTVADDGAGYVQRSTSGHVLSEQASTVVTPNTGVVVLFGSRNDLDLAAAVADSGRVTLMAVASAAPTARVLVVGPVPIKGDSAASTRALKTVSSALRQAAASAGVTYLDPVRGGWVLGTGTTVSSGGRLRLTAAGQSYLATQVMSSLQPLVVAAGKDPSPTS